MSSAGQHAARTTRVPSGLRRLFPGFVVRDGGTARLAPARPPRSSALPGANDLLAGNGGVLAATSEGIFRSADGGVSWQRVLSGVSAWSLTSVLAGGYAALGTLPAAEGLGPAVLATSPDGVHWQIQRVAAAAAGPPSLDAYRFALSSSGPTGLGIAVPDAVWGTATSAALRSVDGGRTWTVIGSAGARSLPAGATTGVAMTPATEYVTAPGNGARCAGAVYQSTDAGVTWSLLPGSCEPYPLMAVEFVSTAQGFAAGGAPAKFGGGQVVEATSDGGRTWRTTWRTQPANGAVTDNGVVRLDMVTAQQGWAITGGCVGGQNGPCGGTVYSTADGGHHWYRTGDSATSIADVGAPGVRAVSGDSRSATSATTADRGRTWSERTPPGWAATASFSGAAGTQVWQNSIGHYLSTDGGARWVISPAMNVSRFSGDTWLAGPPGRLLGFAGATGLRTVVSGNGGRTWTTSAVPDPRSAATILTAGLGTHGSAIAVTGAAAQCLTAGQVRKVERLKPGWKPPAGSSLLFASADGGSTWNRAAFVLPFGVGFPAAATVDGWHLAIIDACNRLQVSPDGGRHWHAHPLGNDVSCSASALRSELWLACQSGPSDFWVLHSADQGSTWTVFRLPAAAAANGMTVTGSATATTLAVTGIAATGRSTAAIPAGGSIWRSADGGASWTQSWPVPPA